VSKFAILYAKAMFIFTELPSVYVTTSDVQKNVMEMVFLNFNQKLLLSRIFL
jgi:hypothetical protein